MSTAFLAALQTKANQSTTIKPVETPKPVIQVKESTPSLINGAEDKYFKFRYQVDTLCKHLNIDQADLAVLAVECLFNQEIKPQ